MLEWSDALLFLRRKPTYKYFAIFLCQKHMQLPVVRLKNNFAAFIIKVLRFPKISIKTLLLPVSNKALLFPLKTVQPEQLFFAAGTRSHCFLALQSSCWWFCYVITRAATACFSSTSRLLLPSLPACYVMLIAPPTRTHTHTRAHTHTHTFSPFLPRDGRLKRSPLLALN